MLDLQVLAPERAPCLSALNPGLWDRGAGRAELLWGVTSFIHPVLSSVSAAAAPCRCWSGRSRARPCTCRRIRIPLPTPPQGQARAGTRTAINQQSPQHHPKPNLWLCSFPISSSALYPAPEPRAWPGSSWIWEQQSLPFGSAELPQCSQNPGALLSSATAGSGWCEPRQRLG